MAKVKVNARDKRVTIALSVLEKIGALHGNVTIGIEQIATVSVTDRPYAIMRGIRAPGTSIPWRIMLGTLRYPQGKDFCMVYGRKSEALVFTLRNHNYKRVFVTTAEAKVLEERIRGLLTERVTRRRFGWLRRRRQH